MENKIQLASPKQIRLIAYDIETYKQAGSLYKKTNVPQVEDRYAHIAMICATERILGQSQTKTVVFLTERYIYDQQQVYSKY